MKSLILIVRQFTAIAVTAVVAAGAIGCTNRGPAAETATSSEAAVLVAADNDGDTTGYYPPRPDYNDDSHEEDFAANHEALRRPGEGILVESLVLRDTPLEDALRMLAEEANINIVFDPALMKGKFVTATLKDVMLDDALSAMLRVNGLAAINVSRGDIEVRAAP